MALGIADTLYMNVVSHLKTVGYVNSYDVCVPHIEMEKKLWTTFPSAILCWIAKKSPLFEKIGLSQWKMDCLPQRRAKNVLWKTKWAKIKQWKVCLPLKKLTCIWRDCKNNMYYGHFSQNQVLNSDKYHSYLKRWKVVIDEKRQELANRRVSSFIKTIWLQTWSKLKWFDRNIVLGLLYSTDVAPFDCELFPWLKRFS